MTATRLAKNGVPLLLLLITLGARGQYYYKDIVVPAQTHATWLLLRQNKVASVTLASSNGDGSPTEGFDCRQDIARDFSRITTYTQSSGSPASALVATYNAAGFLVTTVDTSDTYQSTTEYRYDETNRLASIRNTAIETDNQVTATETHQWTYENGSPVSMLRVRNDRDTTYVAFNLDEKGNVSEEHAVKNGIKQPAVYYYYDEGGRLTDIVRYNEKAKRLLPDYMFEYKDGRLATMIFVPSGSTDYLKWFYEYNDRNLRIRDRGFNKQDQPIGRIDYQYNYQ